MLTKPINLHCSVDVLAALGRARADSASALNISRTYGTNYSRCRSAPTHDQTTMSYERAFEGLQRAMDAYKRMLSGSTPEPSAVESMESTAEVLWNLCIQITERQHPLKTPLSDTSDLRSMSAKPIDHDLVTLDPAHRLSLQPDEEERSIIENWVKNIPGKQKRTHAEKATYKIKKSQGAITRSRSKQTIYGIEMARCSTNGHGATTRSKSQQLLGKSQNPANETKPGRKRHLR